MTASEKMMKLARYVPGVAGYQDRESARETDKAVRLKLAEELEYVGRSIEGEKRQRLDDRKLSLLDELDRLSSKLEKLANTIRFAEQGLGGFFDAHPVTIETLGKLCDFDVSIFDVVEGLKAEVAMLKAARNDDKAFKDLIARVNATLDAFERAFSARHNILGR